MTSADIDVAVIGGGVVGLACALELSRRAQVAVIERHERPGLETSSHNSGVIHAGIYYPTGSLSTRSASRATRCCTRGRMRTACGRSASAS